MLNCCFDKYRVYTSFSKPNILRQILLFLSNLFIILASGATGNSMPSQLSFSDCVRNIFVILSESLATGFNALVMHHLKHSLSSFCILIMAFLLAKTGGSGKYELPFKGLYAIVLISNFVTALNLQLLPRI